MSTHPPVPAEQCIGGREVFEPRLTNGGRTVVYGEVMYGESHQKVVSLLVRRVDSDEPVVCITPEPAMRAARGIGGGTWTFADDHQAIVYTAVDGNLWLQPLDGGTARQITQLGEGRSAMAPHCKGHLVVYVVDLAEVRLVDLAAGDDRRVDDGSSDFVIDPSLTGDGRVAWVAWDVPNMHWDESYVVVADAEGRNSRHEATAMSVQQAQWLADGRTLTICDRSGWAQVCLDGVPIAADSFEHAGPVWGAGHRNYAMSPDGEHIAFTRNERGFGRLCVAHVATGVVIELGRGVHGQVSWQGDTVVALRSGARTPTQLVAYHVPSASRTVLDAGAATEWEPGLLVEPEAIEVLGDVIDGVGPVVHARLYRSPHNDPLTPGRLIVWLHGGPTDQWQVTFMPRLVYWMSRGWNIVVPDHRGSTGHGRAYTQALREQWGVLDVADTIAVARWALETGLTEPGRMVVMGGSAGGFTALSAVASAPGLFSAAATAYPVTDLADLPVNSHRFEQHYTDLLVGPWPQAGATYRERSPSSWPERFVGTPLLVLHGADDPVVSVQQSIIFVDGVRRAGGDATLHIYPGEGHGFRDPVNQLDEYRRLEEFLSAHCR